MSPDPNYPRMMFHRSAEPVIVNSEEEEAALGAGWSRRIFASLPEEEKPAKAPDIEEEPEEWPEEPEEEPAETVPAPPAKPKRGRGAAHYKTGIHKRKD